MLIRLYNTLSRVRQVFRSTIAPYQRAVALLSVLGFLSGLLEAIGLNVLVPLFSLLAGESVGQSANAVSRFIVRAFNFVGLEFRMQNVLIIIGSVFLFKAVFNVATTYLKYKLTFDFEHSLRNRLLGKTIRASWPFLLKQKIGHLEAVIMNDGHLAGLFFQNLSTCLLVVANLAVYVVAAFALAPTITAVTIVFGIGLFVAVRPLIVRKRRYAREIIAMRKQIAHFVNERILGAKVIKSVLGYAGVINQGAAFFKRLHHLGLRSALFSNISTALIQPISLFYVLILFALWYPRPDFNVGAFVVVMYLVYRIFGYVELLQANLHKMNDTFPYLQSVVTYEREIEEQAEPEGGIVPFTFGHSLSFHNVTFSYDKRPVLNDISFTVLRGSFVGIVGVSGGGKTTLVDLLLRLLSPQTGRIEIDGRNAEAITLPEWRKHIGYMAQDIFLFNDTIAENIRLYDTTLNEADIVEAARQADIYDFIRDLPNGLQSLTGERGLSLSAGQRQRIALARVLVRRPKILVLDEATSALDAQTEANIQQTIERLKGQLTIICIAHRLSTIMNCDIVFVLDKGKIVEQGSPAALLQNPDSYFAKVHSLQEK